MSKQLTHPEFGQPIDTSGKPVTKEPIPGGVQIVNASVPTDHESHVVHREQTADEKKLAQKTRAEAVAFYKADTMLFVRMTRDRMMQQTDHFDVHPNAQKIAGGKAKLDAWEKWRQQLRDFPEKAAKMKGKDGVLQPEDVVWPQPPAAISSLLEHRRLWPKLDWAKIGG